jgi:hypothetical protein
MRISYEEKRRAIRTDGRLAVGTLACPSCDAPVAVGPEAVPLTQALICPFCARRGPVRDFLSLATPSRPARVIVRVRTPAGSGRTPAS